jgi:two-component system phosphate regulon sensor histidine kinase PhoR
MGRFLIQLVWFLGAGSAGWWIYGGVGALVCLFFAAAVSAGLGLARGARLIVWLREGKPRDNPFKHGLWAEVADRIRRLVLKLERQDALSQRRLQDFLAAIQASPNGIVLLDGRGAIEWSNQTACDHFGIDAQRDHQQLIANLVRSPVFTDYAKGSDFSHEIVIFGGKSSAARPVLLSVQMHPYADGVGDGKRLLLSRDVTSREQAEVMRRDFVANVSHEIRTPLTVLSGFIETLQNLPLSQAERTRYLDMMATQSQRMQTLVSDLLTLSKLEGSPLPSFTEWTSVAQLQESVSHEARALSHSLAGQVESAQTLVFHAVPTKALAGSCNELLSALSNLVNNAVRYTPAGGKIEVAWTALPDGRLVFSVSDTGPGIAPEHIPRLTERFYRVDHSRSRETGGTGLGLAIVKHVAQRHGAELKIESTLGAGSCFSLSFAPARQRDLSDVLRSDFGAVAPA